MPITVNTNFINQSDQYLLDAKNVKGTYVVVENYSALASLPSATTVNGSLAYCQSSVTVSGTTHAAGFYQYNGSSWSKIDYVTEDKYHQTGSWSGLTYTATSVGNAPELALTIPVGTNSNTVCAGDDGRLSDSRTPVAHASTTTTYGVGTSSNYGHVKLQSGDINGTSATNGVAAGLGHTHSNYGTYSKPSGGIPDSDLSSTFVKTVNSVSPSDGNVLLDSGDILVDTSTTTTYGGSSITSAIDGLSGRIDNAGTVTSVQVQAGTGLTSSQDTVQTVALNTTIGIDDNYKLQTNDEYKDSSLYWISPTGYAGIASALSTRWVVGNAAGFTEPYNGMKIMLRVPVAGVGTAGAMLAIDGGSDWNTYHPIAYNLNTVFTTHYPVNTNKIFVYNSTQTMTGYWMNPLSSQPSDWATKYTSYYQASTTNTDPKATWTAVTGSSAPTFVTGKYAKATSKTYTGVWQGESNYDSNTTMTYGTLAYYLRPYMAQNTLYRYKFVMFDADNRLVPLTTTNNSATAYADYASSTTYAKDVVVHRAVSGVGKWYKSLQASNKGHAPEAAASASWWQEVNDKTPTSLAFRPDKIYWYNTTTTINAGAVIGGNTLMDIGYNQPYITYCNFNDGILAYRMVYLCGTYDKVTGLFTLNDGGTPGSTLYYTQVPTNTANLVLSNYFTSGKDYILVGGTYSSNNYFHLRDDHPMFHFDGTNLVPYDTYNDNRLEGLISQADTWRGVDVNGVELLDTSISGGDINFKNGTNVTITGSGNDITISATDTNNNQTIKGNGTTFGADDAINIKGSGIVSVSGNATDKEIVVSATHQSIKSIDTTASTAQSTNASEAVAGSGTITLHKISKTGTYSDLIGKPTIPSVPADIGAAPATHDHTVSQITDFPSLASVATSGSYNDLSNKPTIPSAPGTLDTTATTAQSTSASEALSGNVKLHKVSKTGSYTDLGNKPTIGTGVLTIQAEGVSKGTFSANATSDVTVNITAADLGLSSALVYRGTLSSSAPAAGKYAKLKFPVNPVVSPTGYADLYYVVTSSGPSPATEVSATIGEVFSTPSGIAGVTPYQEYVITKAGLYGLSEWSELGDEGSYALKTVSISAGTGLTGGGTLASNRTISLADNYGDTKNPYAAKSKNKVLAGPDGSSGHTADAAPVFRELVANDIPDLSSTYATVSSLSTVATSGAYSDLSGKPSLSTVATSGSYNDLSNKPSIPSAPGTLNTTATAAQATSSSEALSGSVTLHKIAKTGTYSDLIGKPTIDTAVNTSSTNAVQNKAISNYIASRGENLLTNGTTLLGNNYNFSALTFDGSQTYHAAGSFRKDNPAAYWTFTNDEYIPVDVNSTYRFDFYTKSNKSGAAPQFNGMIKAYDIDKNEIGSYQVAPRANTLTTLARELKPGDTKIYFTSIANFSTTSLTTNNASLLFYGYKNSYGYEYAPETYTRYRYVNLWSSVDQMDFENNIITLTSAWPANNPTFPVGTSVSQGQDGSGALYCNVNDVGITFTQTAGDWQHCWYHINGLQAKNSFPTSQFPYGTAFIKVGIMNRLAYSSGESLWISTLSFTTEGATVDQVKTGNSSSTYNYDYPLLFKGQKNADTEVSNARFSDITYNPYNRTLKINGSSIKPGTLVTNNTSAQTALASESLTGTVNLHKISKTGTYADLISKPTLDTTSTTALTSGSETINGTISLHKVSKTGSYNDLTNKPSIPSAPGTLDTTATTAQSTDDAESLSSSIVLHKVAKTGTYSDLIGTPTLASVATSGDYGDLLNAPLTNSTYDPDTNKIATMSDVAKVYKHQVVVYNGSLQNLTLEIYTPVSTSITAMGPSLVMTVLQTRLAQCINCYVLQGSRRCLCNIMTPSGSYPGTAVEYYYNSQWTTFTIIGVTSDTVTVAT